MPVARELAPGDWALTLSFEVHCGRISLQAPQDECFKHTFLGTQSMIGSAESSETAASMVKRGLAERFPLLFC